MLPDDRELWACALQVERQHGKDAPRFVAERIGALAVAKDEEGIATWRAIARRLDQLRRGATSNKREKRAPNLGTAPATQDGKISSIRKAQEGARPMRITKWAVQLACALVAVRHQEYNGGSHQHRRVR